MSFRHIASLLITTISLMVIGTPAIADDGEVAPRVEVPIKISYGPKDYIRFSIPVSIGRGQPFDALLDTGSAGLRVLPRAVPYSEYILTNDQVSLSYGNGTVLHGHVALGTVNIGDLSTTGLINFQRIDNFNCVGSIRYCEKQGDIDNALLGASENQPGMGYTAIIGISMKNDPVLQDIVSPLAQMPGNGAYIIEIPAYGATKGTLVINPTNAERQRFTFFHLNQIPLNLPNGMPAWSDKQLPGCFVNHTAGGRYCANTVIDTGQPDAMIVWFAGNRFFYFKPGTDVTFNIGNPLVDGIETRFKVGDPALPGWDKIAFVPFMFVPNGLGLTPDGINLLHPGLMVFFRFDVFYDQQNGLIGLAKHPF